MTIIVTPFSASGDSYATVTQADAHIAALYAFSATWAAKTTAQKEALLKSATLDIDKAFAEMGVYPMTVFQARLWPWDGLSFVRNEAPNYIDSTTQFRVTNLKNQWMPNDYLNNGALFVAQTGDEAAPMLETVAISDFVRSTGAVVHTALSASLSTDDTIYLCPPPPAWLWRATAEQAAFLLNDSAQFTNDQQAGVVSRSSKEGVSVSLKPVRFGWLSAAAYKWLQLGLPFTSHGVLRA